MQTQADTLPTARNTTAETTVPVSDPGPTVTSEPDLSGDDPEEAPLETEVADLTEVDEEPHEDAQPVDGRTLLEGALETTQNATEMWRTGNLEDALTNLDAAYQMLLHIPEEDTEDILQGKENLRLMISKRIVEIYASRRTTAGTLERAIPIVLNEHVAREIKSFQTREKTFFLESYARSGRYRPMILEALRREGMPEQLSWLPLIESGFKTGALSRARALGLWQFIPSTGYRYGLARNQWVDERMDPEKATEAAIAYLHELHDMFGDWLSALAGYNCGEARVMRAINSQRINYLDDFWDLYQKLPRETARYVPRFLATLLILEDPDKYGIELPPLDEPIDHTQVEINRSVKLDELDGLVGVSAGTFRALNPELRYKVTPNKPYRLNVPHHTVDLVNERISSLAQWELPADAYLVHRVRSGETLSTIARKYRTTVSRIMAANNLHNKHRIRQGLQLKIPGKGTPLPRVSGSTAATTETTGVQTHTVQRGDSLWMLARKYNTSVDRIRALNNLRGNDLSIGQKLRIESSQAGVPRVYLVRSGDTLAEIARRHQVGLTALMKANNLSKRDKIYPRQQLILPE